MIHHLVRHAMRVSASLTKPTTTTAARRGTLVVGKNAAQSFNRASSIVRRGWK